MNRNQEGADGRAGAEADPVGAALGAAVQHHQGGRLEEAAALYGKILSADPRQADANHLLGVIALQQGRNEVAVDLIGRAIASNPSFPAFHSNLGNALYGLGRLSEALSAYDAALHLNPDYADAHYNRGNALKDMGRLNEALSAYDAVLRLKPNSADTHYNRGNVLHDLGRLEDALSAYDSALRLIPDYAEAHSNRGNTLTGMGRLDEALAACDSALRLIPDYAEAHNNRGNALKDMGRLDEALSAYDATLRLRPDYADAHMSRGNTLKAIGRLEEALAAYAAVLRLRPDYAEAHYNRGNALYSMERLNEALAAFDTALRLKPDYSEAHNNRGNALIDMGRLREALAACDAALRLRPNVAGAHYNRGKALKDMARPDEALTAYDEAVRLRPDFAIAHSSKLLVLHYVAFEARGAIAAAARAFGTSVSRADAVQAFANAPIPDRRLRIGYVSGDLRGHPVGYFLQSILRHHASDAVEVFCYSNNLRDDDLTASFRSEADHWRGISGLTDEAAASLIRADGIDVLVDLSGHTARNRLPLFARRPAPVQVSWLGYFGTTGLAAMDYVLADRFVVPPGEEDAFTEQVWRMPDSYLCFKPPDLDVPVRRGDADGPITFGSFNNLAKLSAHTVSLWAQVLQSVPRSRLLLKTGQLADPAVRQSVRERFAGHGIEADRLLLEGPSPWGDYLASYNRVDIALDPLPYGGGTTTADGLWMGVPVVTLRGGTWVGRISESILSTVGLPELVAGSPGDYIALAAELAADRDRRAALHAGLRSRLEGSAFCDGPGFTWHLEEAYRGMWTRWCEQGSAGV